MYDQRCVSDWDRGTGALQKTKLIFHLIKINYWIIIFLLAMIKTGQKHPGREI
jgi:hypothetical protein